MSVLLQPNEIRSMPAQAVRRILEAGDGDCALLYLALLECNEYSAAQQALHWGDERLKAAHGRLAELGLVSAESAPAAPKKESFTEVPQYSREDVLTALEQEPEFCGLYREVERLLGRSLGDTDLASLYTVYDGLALPVEVILLLVSYVSRAVRQSGKTGATPRMNQIKTEAFRWKRRGLDTVEAVEQYLRLEEQINSREWEILSAAGITEFRRAVTDERKFIASWVEMGYGKDLIALACEKTIYSKGKMNWPYANKILLSWHQAGYRTVEQVKAGDKPAARTAPVKPGRKQEDYQPSDDRIRKNTERLKQLLEE